MTKNLKHKNISDDIIPPDGGWGWLVCIAGGLSLFLTFSIRKTFGLIFRESFEKLGITNSEITTIINFHIAIASFQGFLYGPIYSYMSIRQVAIASAILIVFGIFLLAFVETFAGFVIAFSIIYGLGTGFNKSATFLSINTYFDKLRRRAHSITLTLSAIGPMVMPQTVNILLYIYGVQGSVIIFSAVTMNIIAFGLIYQPVIWHAKKSPKDIFTISNNNNNIPIESSIHESNTIIDEDSYNYIDKYNNKKQDIKHNFKVIKEDNHSNANCENKKDILNYDHKNIEHNQINDSEFKELRININEIDLKLKNNEINNLETKKTNFNSQTNNFKFLENHKKYDSKENSIKDNEKTKDNNKKNYFKKISSLFDLDLLCDLSYLNIIFGLAFANVCELNFTLLTPFILSDFGFDNHKIAAAMSTRAFTDLISRFLLPYITIKIKWNSRIFFLIGMSGSTLTRLLIAQNPSYINHLILFGLTGIFTSIRSVFINLILPEYLPLIKLPSGTGLQQIPAGIFALIMGPVIGMIRDATNYSFVLYVLSIFSALTIISWTIELIWVQMKTKVFKLI